MTYDDAAEMLGISRRTIQRYVDSELLNSVRIGRSVRIAVVEIEKFVAERERRHAGT